MPSPTKYVNRFLPNSAYATAAKAKVVARQSRLATLQAAGQSGKKAATAVWPARRVAPTSTPL